MTWEEDRVAEEPTVPQCPHHWVIEPADGPTSEGVCRKCAEVKTFAKNVAQNTWSNQGDPTPSASQVRDRKRSRPEGQAEGQAEDETPRRPDSR